MRSRFKSGLACIKGLRFHREKEADVFVPSLGPNRLTDGECLASKEPERVERSLDAECIISSLTSWVLYEAIVLSVLCSSQRNKEPFETKKAKSISRASE